MTTLDLTHSYTPLKLEELNKEINEILGEKSLDTNALLQLINQRDKIVNETLVELTDRPEEQAQFSLAEQQINELLLESIKGYRQVTQDQLRSLIKGRKAVQKYA